MRRGDCCMVWPMALALAMAAWSARAAEEQDEAATPSGAVYLGTAADDAAAATAGELLRSVVPGTTTGAPVHLADFISAKVGGGEVLTLQVGAVSVCDGESVSAADYRALLDGLDDAFKRMDDLSGLAADALAAWACLDEVMTPAELGRVPFMQGIDLCAGSGCDAARDAFAGARVVDPSLPFDPNFGPSAEHCYSDAVLAVTDGDHLGLHVLPPPGGQAWVDGLLVAARPEGRRLAAGRHLVQFRTADGAMQGVALDLSGIEDALVAHAGVLEILSTPAAGIIEDASSLMRAAASRGIAMPEYLVLMGEEPKVYRWDEGAQSLVTQVPPTEVSEPGETAPRDVPVLKRPGRKIRAAGGVMLGSGLALVGVGGVMAAVGHGRWSQATADWDLDAGVSPYGEEAAPHYRLRGVGIALAAAGGALSLASIPLLVRAARMDRNGGQAIRPEVAPTLDGAWLGISGQF